jgi:aspartate racemase
MKTVGLIGGMSNESTALYYKLINNDVNTILGDYNTAQIIIVSLNFNEVILAMRDNKVNKFANLLIAAARKLEACHVDIIGMCCSAANKLYPQIQQAIKTPILNIFVPVCENINKMKLKTVAFLATQPTMEDDFYSRYFKEKTNVDIVIPNFAERVFIHNVIYEQLCRGIVDLQAKKELMKIINRLSVQQQSAQAIILGCTELPLLISHNDVEIPILDLTELHSLALSNYAVQP